MNKYQKIVLLIGAILILIFFGRSLTKIGFTAIGFLWKGIAVAIVTFYIISFLKKAGK